MARSAPIIPVNAAMYRHFAVATVMITGCLAMFASGENRQALEDRLEARQQQSQATQSGQTDQKSAQAKEKGAKGNFTDKRKVKGSFGTDAELRWKPPPLARRSVGSAATTEAELVAAADVSFVDAGNAAPSSVTVSGKDPLPPGMSPAEYDAMMNAKKKKKKPLPEAEKLSEEQMSAIIEASKARSQTRRD